MNDGIIQPDNAAEAKANSNLAIWIGVLGLGSFGLCYALFFALMAMQPGVLFKLIPSPSITGSALSDGTRTYLLQEKLDMSTVDPRQKKQPEVRHVLSVLEGAGPQAAQEIPPFTHASGANNRLLFLSKGVYRIYDGSRWVEERSEAVGKDPRGVLSTAGLYVLSRDETGPHLRMVASGAAIEITLPAEYLAGYRNDQCPCEKLALYQGRLCLFWTGKESFSWAVRNGDSWSPAVTAPFSGEYQVIADDSALYLFQRAGDGDDRRLSYTVFANNAWSDPVFLTTPDGILGWSVFLRQGKPRLFAQRFPTPLLYTVEKDALVEPVRLKGPFEPFRMMGGGTVLLLVLSNVLSLFLVFGASAGLRRFKKRIWNEPDTQYEFASLFRRFVAMMLDNLVILVPPGILIALAWHGMEQDLEGNPLLFVFKLFFAGALFLVGGLLYHSLLEGLCGQTVGKKVCGIRVLKADFSPCGLTAGFLRNLLRIADAFFYYLVAVISLAATFKWQRIGDLVADTIVVKVHK